MSGAQTAIPAACRVLAQLRGSWLSSGVLPRSTVSQDPCDQVT